MPDAKVSTTPVPRAVMRQLIARQALPLAVIVVILWLLRDRAAGLDVAGILSATRAIPPAAWAAAAAATCVSFWALGRYDAVIHRLLDTGVAEPAARMSGIVAIATSQTAGFGLLTGTLARWRMLPRLSLWQSARVTMTVTASFMAGLAVVAAGMVLWLGGAARLPVWPASTVLAIAAGFALVSLWRPRALLHLSLPPLRAQGAILGLVALDTVAAALVLYALLPAGTHPPAATFYAVFLLALGAGLIGATPGGVGPFEVVILALLPQLPEAGLLAAIAGYRLIYFGLPGAVAACLLVAGGRQQDGRDRATMIPAAGVAAGNPALDTVLRRAPRAEAQLVRQGEIDLLAEAGTPVALAAATGQSLVVLGDPLGHAISPARLMRLTIAAARERCLTPVLYKASARTVVAARRAGWRVAPVSDEAWIAPAGHDLSRPQCRQLRRQLRKAGTAGLHACVAGAFLPVDEMQTIAKGWAARRGGARGFSLGRFSPGLLPHQRVFLCFNAQRRLVAFATFHICRSEWSLDQMCHTENAAPGAMHLLIAKAIETAARENCPRLSLAAAPRRAPAWLPGRIAALIDRGTGTEGLTRFKNSFGPRWQPLYVAAPTRVGLAMGALDLMDRITRPGRRGAFRAVPR